MGLIAERGAAVAGPGEQAPGIADNGVALRPRQLRLPSITLGTSALGISLEQKILTEVGTGTSLSPANELAHHNATAGRQTRKTRQTRTRTRRVQKPSTEFVCEECTRRQGCIVSFNCNKDLNRHRRTTKVHRGPAVAECSCGKTVSRKDARRLHRRHCGGSWL